MLNRREFLVGAVAATVGACGSGSGITNQMAMRSISGLAGVVTSSDLHESSSSQRFAFVVTNGGRLAGGRPAQVGFLRPGASEGRPTVAPLYRGEGLDVGSGVYVTQPVFDIPGTWMAAVRIGAQQFTLAAEVWAAPQSFAIGELVPRAPSPTVMDPLGVDPIFTRRPACPFHDRSLGELVGRGRATVFMFGTPARGRNAYCGPVLNLLVAEATRFQYNIDVVHVEIYEGSSGEKLSPTLDAWGVPVEPWLVALDGTGRIVGRLNGACGRTEIRELLSGVVP